MDFAKAALAEGDSVVATGRNPDAVAEAVGEAGDLLARQAGRHQHRGGRAGGAGRFGRIDVLVNYAGTFYAGYFEDLTLEQIVR